MTRVAHAGVGGWGKNVVRVIGELTDLAWVIDTDEGRQADYAARYPQATVTGSFADALADDTVDAVSIATPVPTHYALAKQALEAGKHVFVEKPPAMRGEEMEELVALARANDRVLMPGHLLLYHPGLRKVKELVDAGELGDVACVYGNRQNLGVIRSNENALWSLGVHDLSVILWLLGEEPSEVVAYGQDFVQPGIEDVVFCFLRFPSGKVAHMHLSWLDPHKMRKMTVVGREKMVVFDDMELERKVTVYEKGPWEPAQTYGEWRTRTGDIFSPKIANDEPLRLELQHFLRLVEEGPGDHREATDGLAVVQTLDRLTTSLRTGHRRERRDPPERDRLPRHRARRGRQGARERGRRQAADALAPLDRKARAAAADRDRRRHDRLDRARSSSPARRSGSASSSATSRACASASTIGDDVVVGRGSLVENDTTIGAMTKIQADAYITAYSTLEEHVFIAPCVVTTNDNWMGRTEKRFGNIKGPTIRRGARIGGGAILCPAIEIGEDAFVGAGAVVTKDVPPRVVVVGSPARVLRDVPEDELLDHASP